MKKSLLLLAFFALVFSACKKSSNTTPTVDPAIQAKIDDDLIKAYIAANNLTAVKDPSGLYYQIIDPGSGTAPTVKSTVTVAYVGKLLNGSPFDSSSNYTALLGGNLIQGWKIGIPYIKPGGRILLIIPSALAYGPPGKGSIPPNTVLIFTIDLFQVQG